MGLYEFVAQYVVTSHQNCVEVSTVSASVPLVIEASSVEDCITHSKLSRTRNMLHAVSNNGTELTGALVIAGRMINMPVLGR